MARIGFIGAGNMAEAIARGLLRAGLYSPSDICSADPSADRQRLFRDELGISCFGQPAEVASRAETLILAVKPFVVGDVLAQIAPSLKPNSLLISIAAGISIGFMESAAAKSGNKPRVIRVMPNTPMLVGKGMSAIARGSSATDTDVFLAERIFGAGGKTVRVDEAAMDAVTAVSGSGPAYVFYLCEILAAAGVKAGLPEDQAALLARQTVTGSAAMLEFSKEPPAELRRKVTTPGGTTQAAIETMQTADLPGIFTKAIAAAAARSKEMGK
jgi:pyrroline-5-carboxylate reductase